MIRFACAECRKVFTVADGKAGARFTCPKCQSPGIVPRPPQPLPPPPPPPPQPPTDALQFDFQTDDSEDPHDISDEEIEYDDEVVPIAKSRARQHSPNLTDWMGLGALLLSITAFCIQGVAIFFWLAYPFGVCAIVLGGITLYWGNRRSNLAIVAIVISVIALAFIYPTLKNYWDRDIRFSRNGTF